MRRLVSLICGHFPGVIALFAAAVIACLWFWLMQDTGGMLPVPFGWRVIAIIFCLGLVLGGLAAEATALAAWTAPGETPIGSIVIALIFALPFYGVAILISRAATN